MSVNAVARQLLEACDPARGQTPSATITSTYRALTEPERRRVDRLVVRARHIAGLRAHRRLPLFLRPFVALHWCSVNAFRPQFAPLAWLTRGYIRDASE